MSSDIDEIKSKTDIIDLIGGYIKLTPAGANFKALCPFHNEKTPSMMVNPAKQVWRCFGCGEGGDSFDFLMKIEGIDFVEAKKELAQKAGVVLQQVNLKEESQKARILEIMELSKKYYNYVLLNSQKVQPSRDYLKDRGLTEETIEDWKIGCGFDGWDSLMKFLQQKGYSDNEINLSGMSVQRNSGKGSYDRFRGRIMFPIADVSGRTVAFTARVSPQNEETEKMGKYINSPQTTIYSKSRILFGLDKAKTEIKKQDQAIIVEGQMDVITAHQNGYKNVIASSGTALTTEQLMLIKRYTGNILFALDADEAGQNAIERGIASAGDMDVNIKVIEIPSGKDPDDCIKNSPKEWEQAVEGAKPVMQHYFDRALKGLDLSNIDNKLIVIKSLGPKLNLLQNQVVRDFWVKDLSQKLNIEENTLRGELAKIDPEKQYSGPTTPKQAIENKTETKEALFFKRILSLLFLRPLLLPTTIDRLPLDLFTDETIKNLYKNLALFYTKDNNLFSENAVDKSQEIDLYDLFNGWLQTNNIATDKKSADLWVDAFLFSQKESDLEDRVIKEELDRAIGVLREGYLKNRIDDLNNQLDKADDDNKEKILEEISHLIRERNG